MLRTTFLAPVDKRWRWGLLWMGLVMLPVAYRLFGPAGVRVELVSKTWQRDIEIEVLVNERSSDWCDQLPAGVRELSRQLMADPTGKRAGAADYCRYMGRNWHALRSAHAEGASPRLPVWPVPELKPLAADELGAERTGLRHERYEIILRAANGRQWTCRLPQVHWQQLAPGLSFRIPVDRYGTADCSHVPERQ